VVHWPPTLLWAGGHFFYRLCRREQYKMDVRLYVGNLAKSTTSEELNTLFAQAGTVNAVEVIKDRDSGESKGFAFITMNTQEDGEKAISKFNAYKLSERELKVNVAKPRIER
jgi:RNA recognition motif-containing protein